MTGIPAEHLTIHEWLERVSDAVAQLPEFQRDVVWKPDRVAKFLDAILENRPVGCLLVLKVRPDGVAPFCPRPIEGAMPSSDRPIEYLILDGQQRITALWRALMESEEKRRYFIPYSDPTAPRSKIQSIVRKEWQDDPKECLRRGLIPIALLRYTPKPDDRKHVTNWIDDALTNDDGTVAIKRQRELEGWISTHSEQIRNFRIPHLLMPDSTTPSQAINTFVESNISSLKLRKFDIAVAETLALKNPSLRSARGRVWNGISGLDRYLDLPTVGDLLLKVACLRSGLDPVESNYDKPNVLADVAGKLEEIAKGISWVVELLEEDRIWDSRRLPSVVPFRVLPALHKHLPKASSARGAMAKTARAYLWRAFLTKRYRSSAASLLKQDFDGLQKVMTNGGDPMDHVPIWRQELPTKEEIRMASWPTKSALPRALLAVSVRRGARDIGSGEEARKHTIAQREYHHLFPVAYLERQAAGANANVAMNCVLIRGRTNREASDKAPLTYLKSLVVEKFGSEVSEQDLKSRLVSHLVRIDSLRIREQSVETAYNKFLTRRASQVRADVDALVDGRDP